MHEANGHGVLAGVIHCTADNPKQLCSQEWVLPKLARYISLSLAACDETKMLHQQRNDLRYNHKLKGVQQAACTRKLS